MARDDEEEEYEGLENYLIKQMMHMYLLARFCDSVVARDGKKQENLLLAD
jgi:hypothetical protein